MGLNHSVTLQSHSALQQKWLPRDTQSNVLVNKITKEQVQRHYFKILGKDLPRQWSLFVSRMNSQQPYVCRLLYFHLLNKDLKAQKYPEMEVKEMCIYTDRLQQIKDWGRQKVVQILLGLRKLIAMYGPFRVNENNIRESEKGEVKLWISENPASNYPDCKYMNQEQTVRDLETLLFRKNCEIVNIFIGCRTLRDIADKLRRVNAHDQISKFRLEDGRGTYSKQLISDKRVNEPTQNSLKQMPFVTRSKDITNGYLNPQKSVKNIESKPQSAMSQKQKKKLSFNMGTISSKQFYFPAKHGILPSQSQKNIEGYRHNNVKINNETSLELKQEEAQQLIAQIKAQKIQFQKLELYSKKGQNKMLNVNSVKYMQPFQPVRFSHKIQTEATLPTSTNTHSSKSPKEQRNTYCISGEHFQLNRFNSKSKIPRLSFLQVDPLKQKKADIAMLSNKINNAIAGHNLIAKIRQNQQFNQISKVKRQGQVHRSKERNYNIPVFIKQRKKQIIPFEKKDKIIPNYQQVNNIKDKSFQVVKKNTSKRLEHNEITKSVKNFDISRYKEPSMSPFKFNSNFKQYPQTPTPISDKTQTFQQFDRQNNCSFESRIPHRTKTTEFYAKVKDNFNNYDMGTQDKSFARTEKKMSDFKPQQKICKYLRSEPSILEDSNEQFSAQSPKHQKTSAKKKIKSNFKKQLRQELKFLLGEEIMAKTQKKQTSMKSEEEIQEQQETIIKDKIKMKKKEFAELKKQALKVLTDF